MTSTKLPTIVDVIGRHFTTYTQALTEAQNLAGREELDADERSKFSELIQYLENDKATAGLLNSEQRGGLEKVLEVYSELNVPLEMMLDEYAAEGGVKMTQDEWIDSWNLREDDTVMASMGDYYQFFKQLRIMDEEGTPEERAKVQTLLVSLRNDFDWPEKKNWLTSSTRILYEKEGLRAKIIQHYRCKQPELIKETELEIPVYRGTLLTQVADENKGLFYLQTLFDTEDGREEIIETLEFVSGKSRDAIKVWTAATSGSYTRKEYSERAGGFYYDYDDFHVNGSDTLKSQGCSRGVFSAAGTSQKK